MVSMHADSDMKIILVRITNLYMGGFSVIIYAYEVPSYPSKLPHRSMTLPYWLAT